MALIYTVPQVRCVRCRLHVLRDKAFPAACLGLRGWLCRACYLMVKQP